MTHAVCRACGRTVHITPAGTMRRHPKGAEVPCPGTGATQPTINSSEAPAPTTASGRPAAGLYRSDEEMMDPGVRVPYGHATVSVVAHFPYDGSNGRTPEQEAAKLFEDPDYLSQVLDKVPNNRIRILMKVEP